MTIQWGGPSGTKVLRHYGSWRSMALAFAVLLPTPVLAEGPLLQLDHLKRLASEAKEVVDVSVDPAMLQQAAGLLPSQKTDDATRKAVVSGLKAIYVKSFEFDREGVYTDADVDAVREQLKTPWSRIVGVQSREDRELVEVYLWREGDQIGGLAVVVAEPKELTVVNIVGRIDLAQLAALGGQFGIPKNLGVAGAAAQKPKPKK